MRLVELYSMDPAGGRTSTVSGPFYRENRFLIQNADLLDHGVGVVLEPRDFFVRVLRL